MLSCGRPFYNHNHNFLLCIKRCQGNAERKVQSHSAPGLIWYLTVAEALPLPEKAL